MNGNYIDIMYKMNMSVTHSLAYYGIDTSKNAFIKNGARFNRSTDLSGTVESDLGERVVSAISSFGVTGVRIHSIECGPVVTRVNLSLPRGVRTKTVSDLSLDLAMQLKVKSVSFTPVPEKGVLALDIPAANRKTVLQGNVHTANTEGMRLPLELGVTVTGTARAIDLAKAPHLLIAGQTGSGKSVCINSIICSLVRNVSLSDFDLMLVDPKGVELNDYEALPNCINGKVLVEPGVSLDGLRWLCDEMDRRYALLTKYCHRNIHSYNEWVKTMPVGVDCVEKMRYIVCVVDEFADLMMTSGAELTSIVQRLAQKSRAVGIHLILATQRPSVKVVTGDLKANLPCRIAFKVSSSTDSVTILGHGGAERLLGMGDMILSNNEADERLHGVYMDDKDIRTLVKVVCSSTVSTLKRSYNFVSGAVSTWCGGSVVPSWVAETVSECGSRCLAKNTPEWVARLVEVNRNVWRTDNIGTHDFNHGLLVCRMGKYYATVEAMRDYVEPHLTEDNCPINHINSDLVAERVFDLVTRLAVTSIYGFGIIADNFKAAYKRNIPVDKNLVYLRTIA